MAGGRRRSITPLTVRLKQYIAVRRHLDYDRRFTERVLRMFAEFAAHERAAHITVDLFLRWKRHYGLANNHPWGARRSMARVFAGWLQGFDPRTEVPPPGLIRAGRAGRGPTSIPMIRSPRSALKRLGLREPQPFCKHGHGPRVHALRHTCAVRTIMDWHRRGLDPDREMLKLSAYLGHTKPEFTYWYIEASLALRQLACERAERNLAGREAR